MYYYRNFTLQLIGGYNKSCNCFKTYLTGKDKILNKDIKIECLQYCKDKNPTFYCIF